jgi:hypothetical protein
LAPRPIDTASASILKAMARKNTSITLVDSYIIF